MLLSPDYRFKRVWEIEPGWLAEKGIRLLLLDVDNTLTTHDNPVPDPKVIAWLDQIRAAGVQLAILSNNRAERVRPFAEGLGLGWEARAAKPLTFGARRACERLDFPKQQAALVGDQIFTDILCANLSGMTSIMVDFIEPEPFWFFRIKRRLEQIILYGGKARNAGQRNNN